MNKNIYKIFFVSILCSLFSFALKASKTESFNKGWQFTLSDSVKYRFFNYESNPSENNQWKSVTLPHDWSVSFDFDTKDGEPNTGYLLGGIAWYAKEFETETTKNQKCFIVFDGVYNNSEYWINGRKIGEHPYGYSPYVLDVTNYLRPHQKDLEASKKVIKAKKDKKKDVDYLFDGKNRLSVRVDHSHYADSRWYTGSGIYRNVTYVITDKFYIPVWGTYITTPEVSKEKASVKMNISLKNEYTSKKKGKLISTIYDNKGKAVSKCVSFVMLKNGENKEVEQGFDIENPNLWSVENPNRYDVKTELICDGKILQTYNSKFGVRSIRFDSDKGFFLNDVNMKVKGVCLHHCAGLVGAAVPKDVWKRRLQTLKEGGCNAIRTAHNPVSEEFLDLCDEMGFLVQDEFFDAWDNPKDKRYNTNLQVLDDRTVGYCEHFQEWSEKDLKNTMLRDRNHPCVFQWSIGNEIEWTYPRNKVATGFWSADASGGYFWNIPPYSPERIKANLDSLPRSTYDIGETAHKLANWTREMDTTRPVIANCILPSVSYESGYIDALDMVGFSYRRIMYDYCHKNYPNKPIMGTENVAQYQDWKAIEDRDFICGTFLWTGIDYMGEVRRPSKARANTAGLLDEAGFKKPSYYMMKSLWSDEPSIGMYSQISDKSQYKVLKDGSIIEKKPGTWEHRLWSWYDVRRDWNYKEGDNVIVELYSNCPEIELFQNGKSLGSKKLDDFVDHIYKWNVNYKDGYIKAVGKKNGKTIKTYLKTAGKAEKIVLELDRESMEANGRDVLHIVAKVVDKHGVLVQNKEFPLNFEIKGEYKLLGVDNGDSNCLNKYKSQSVPSFHGKALLEVQAPEKIKGESSLIKISATSGDLKSKVYSVVVK